MTRRRNKKMQDARTLVGIGIFVVVFMIMGALLWLRPAPIERDRNTLCRSDGPSSITAILLDSTDSFGATTKQDLSNQMWNCLNESEENHEISIFAVDSTRENTLEPIIQVCNPGDPDEANPLIQSKEIIERKWNQQFRQPLDEKLDSLLTAEEAPSSPIMESVQSVSITHFQSAGRDTIPRRLIIISDLLQNSDEISFYREAPDFNRFQQTPKARWLNPDLRDVDIEIWLIQRRHPQQGDGGALLKFFQSWLEEHGGRVVRVLRTSGIND